MPPRDGITSENNRKVSRPGPGKVWLVLRRRRPLRRAPESYYVQRCLRRPDLLRKTRITKVCCDQAVPPLCQVWMVLHRARPPRREANHEGMLGGRREEEERRGGTVLFSKQEPNRRRVGKNKTTNSKAPSNNKKRMDKTETINKNKTYVYVVFVLPNLSAMCPKRGPPGSSTGGVEKLS